MPGTPKSYSVIIVPSDHSGTRQFRISRRLVVTAVAIAGLFGVVILGFVITYGTVLQQARRADRLAQQNVELLNEVESVRELGAMVEDLSSLRAQVISLLGSETDDFETFDPAQHAAAEREDLFSDPVRIQQLFADASRQPFAPTHWPLPGRVVREFIPQPEGDRPAHPGLSLSPDPTGQVEAAGRGQVVEVGESDDGGAYVQLDHGYGFRTHYGGLARVRVREGQVLEQGTLLGDVTGEGGSRSEASTLYFEIQVDGSPVDPRRYLSSR